MNDGFTNEKNIINYINQNSFENYNKNIQDFLKFVFQQEINPSFSIQAEKNTGQIKSDLCLKYNGDKKFISIKKGSGNSVHQEKIDLFFDFFKDSFGSELLDNLKLFHYGDDTTDDSGTERFNASISKIRYSEKITLLNQEINKWEHLNYFLDRFLFQGNVSSTVVDVIYYGDLESGLWASKDEITSYIKNKDFFSNTLHFGPLTYQVWGRDEKRTSKNPNRRYVMQIKWCSIKKDLENIRKENKDV